MVKESWNPSVELASLPGQHWSVTAQTLATALASHRYAGWAVQKTLLAIYGSLKLFTSARSNWLFIFATLSVVLFVGIIPVSLEEYQDSVQAFGPDFLRMCANLELVMVVFVAFTGGAPGVVTLALGANYMIHTQGVLPKPPLL
eukprot:FR742473.1.p1 GENE.FR742473.1~~FR742473.1.p1  ORF type:complete len:144 (+),score=10.24 FR742473.1:3-434(+)